MSNIVNRQITNRATKEYDFGNILHMCIKNKGNAAINYDMNGRGSVTLDPGEVDNFFGTIEDPICGKISFTYPANGLINIKITSTEKA